MIHRLYEIIEDRKTNPVQGSYTNTLLKNGYEKTAQKVGEEAVELIIAAGIQNQKRVIEEAADLVYHLFVLLVQHGIRMTDIERELEIRHGNDGDE